MVNSNLLIRKNVKLNNMNTLFDIDPIEPISPDKFCRTCQHRERRSCNSKIIQYCGIRKSNRTDNGQLKIKCKTVACSFYKEDVPAI